MSLSCISSTGHCSKRAAQRGVGPARHLWLSPPLSLCPVAPAAPFFSNVALLPPPRPWHQLIPAQTVLLQILWSGHSALGPQCTRGPSPKPVSCRTLLPGHTAAITIRIISACPLLTT